MNIRYDLDKLKRIMDNIHVVTGLSLALVDTKYNHLYTLIKNTDAVCNRVHQTVEGATRCKFCDSELLKQCTSNRHPVSHICHAGLLDTVVPIFKNEIIAGYIIIGRVLPDSMAYELQKKNSDYCMMSSFSEKKMQALVELLSHIIFENAIEVDYDEFISRAMEYIDNNITSDMSVDSLCEALYVSRNYLYKSFRSFFGCTVNEYIIERRVKMAERLLRSTENSVSDIAESVGFMNYTYFSRLFKNRMGMSPSKYRKML